MRYLSVCSGIEAATVAWQPLGWEAVGFSEIEKFPSAVLAHHYPDVPNHGDMNDHEGWTATDIDVLVGGTPCQSFSVAGLRQGMVDPRGNLALVYLAIAEQFRPRWLVWENVPGVLSSHGGRDFGSIIGGMVELGYCPTWRVLDAQYFGVAQRRRRVFVVASARDWRDSAKVLLEPACMLRNYPPRRSAEKGTTPDVAKSLKASSGGIDREDGHTLIPETASAVTTRQGRQQPPDFETYLPEVVGALSDGAHCGGGLNGQDAYSGRIIPWAFNWQNGGGYGDANEGLGIAEDEAGPLSASQVQAIAFKPGSSAEQHAVAFAENQRGELRESDCTDSLKGTGGKPGQGYQAVREDMIVRRLTPTECERLQGFPDGYTNIPGASDSARYRALGNTMAVPVMRWIGERIDAVEKTL